MLQFLVFITDESDRSKIEYLYKRYHDDMLRFAKYRLHRMGWANYELDAEDAVQNAFVKITKYIHAIDFSVEEKEMKAYVLAIVSNETINITTEYAYCDDMDGCIDELEDGDFFGELRIRERYDTVVDIIGRMDEKYSIALLCRYKENLSVKEMSELLGIAEKTIYTRIERGRRMLLEILNEEK